MEAWVGGLIEAWVDGLMEAWIGGWVTECIRINWCIVDHITRGGVIIQWGHPKVKTKVHHPPNLIPMIDIRCFA